MEECGGDVSGLYWEAPFGQHPGVSRWAQGGLFRMATQPPV